MAAINSVNVFTPVPSEVMQQILTEAQVDPRVALVSKRWRDEIRDMTLRTFSYILKVDQKSLSEEQIQQAKDLFINAVKDHRHYYKAPKPRMSLFSTPKSVIYPTLPLISIERCRLIMADLELAKHAKRANDTMEFWKEIPGGENHILAEKARIPGISDVYILEDLNQWIQDNSEVPYLRGLSLGEKNLRYLPVEIRNLTALQKLWLKQNQFTALPPEIGQLTNLQLIELESNKLIELPVEIGHLIAITDLRLNSNQLIALPAEIGSLTALTRLCLHNNQLTELPAEIGNLTALTRLDLYNNQLTELPAEIGNLTVLTSIGLSRNQLTELPAEIGNLIALQGLELDNNQLTELPAEIGKLKALDWLSLSGNPLKRLPSSLAMRKSILKLYIEITLEWERDVKAYQALSVEKQNRVYEWMRRDEEKSPVFDDLEKFHEAMIPYAQATCNLL